MKVHVEVTLEDICNGKREDASECPVALALERLFPGDDISVNYDSADASGYRCRLPETAKKFVADFDLCRDVAPFSFELDLFDIPDDDFDDD